VGRHELALIDPGPDVARHVRALLAWVEDASSVRILLTHGHQDHSGASRAVATALGAPIHGPPGLEQVDHPLTEGEAIETGEGEIVAVATPGHARWHFSYLWPRRRALFAGDLVLGRGDTTWVGEYPGCVSDYLASLERLRELELRVIYPAHGDPLEDVPDALDRFEVHRRARIREVEEVLRGDPDASIRRVLEKIYGPDLPPTLEAAALRSVRVLVGHVRAAPGGDTDPGRPGA